VKGLNNNELRYVLSKERKKEIYPIRIYVFYTCVCPLVYSRSELIVKL